MSGLSNKQEFTRTIERTNQGIVDGRPEGQNPPRAPVTRDTVVDKDASLSESSGPMYTSASDTLGGATSADVTQSMGYPGSGMSSKELHHDGKPGRKRDGQGVDQWGPPGVAQTELDRAQRETGRDREAFAQDQ
ncbi:hypothetical protein E1B28_003104 [Marasmius oreades]|uniref:Uncharacterized protein n=1 Tax=Marasmius oreades TaxID=181124 RepID=A0A9P7UJ80_9AGAR|nr:uncharacterized protein E1B28_003104 [Marasmius oreades]KAG7085547.1 hypothetical protein E1B28_003104 [Marasmius oreades]